jgi:hypothetical protein
VDSLTAAGEISPSVYETGRVVALLPSLMGHAERVDFLLTTQQPQGHWGPAHAGYALIPTLSATDALLAVQQHGPHELRIATAVRGALRGLAGLAEADLPDLPAADLIVATLVPRIEQHLSNNLEGDRPQHLPGWLRELAHRSGMRFTALKSLLTGATQLEPKLLHAAETFGEIPWLDKVQPTAAGSIGASPAATAAWLAGADASGRPGTDAARRYLRRAIRKYGGPLPCVWPAPVFERAWVLNWLLHSGIRIAVPQHLLRSLHASLGPEGAATAPGLPPDADTTSMVLATLTLLGKPIDPTPLLRYEFDTCFCTWPGEQGQSVTTNAHVLEALGLYVRARPAEKRRYTRVVQKISDWLCAQQQDWGGWEDRWHASPYYATFCTALALHRFADPQTAPAQDRAIRWLLETQHADGSWGIWGGTPEETAYALQTLKVISAAAKPHPEPVARARDFLTKASSRQSHPALWHDKDLYRPTAIVNTAILVALD